MLLSFSCNLIVLSVLVEFSLRYDFRRILVVSVWGDFNSSSVLSEGQTELPSSFNISSRRSSFMLGFVSVLSVGIIG